MDSKALPVIDVSAGLVFRAGKLLITKRHDDAHLGGLWEFPGGKREPNETFEQCLARELHEELGIEVLIRELVESITHQYPERTVHLKFFSLRLVSARASAAWLRGYCVGQPWRTVPIRVPRSRRQPFAEASLLAATVAQLNSRQLTEVMAHTPRS